MAPTPAFAARPVWEFRRFCFARSRARSATSREVRRAEAVGKKRKGRVADRQRAGRSPGRGRLDPEGLHRGPEAFRRAAAVPPPHGARHDEEFIAASAHRQVGVAYVFLQHPGDAFENPVSRTMGVVVVDGLETILVHREEE